VTGVEFASLFSALGSEVSVVETLDEILPFMDREQAPALRRALAKVSWKLGRRVTAIEGGRLRCATQAGEDEVVEADLILMAAGRRPKVTGFGAERVGLDAGPKGVAVDERMRMNLPGGWAAGVGLTEEEARARGFETRRAQVPLRLSGRFAAENGFTAPGAVTVADLEELRPFAFGEAARP
jgi:dihydrolipoamide dehydrogenase